MSPRRGKKAFYPVSVDPITWGHLDLIKRGADLFDGGVTIGIGVNPAKKYLFTAEERVDLTMVALKALHMKKDKQVDCTCFSGLTTEYAYRHGYAAMLRGVRGVADLEDELLLHAVNSHLKPELETVLLPCRPQYAQFSSTILRALVKEGGNAHGYAPTVVKEAAEKRMLQRTCVGVVGSIGSGKSLLCQRLVAALQHHPDMQHTPIHAISLDQIGHYVLSEQATEPCYLATKELISSTFSVPLNEHGALDRQALGRIVFADPQQLDLLSELMRSAMTTRLYQVMGTKSGLFLLEGAVLIERGWAPLVNNTIVMVDAPRSVRVQRLLARPGHSLAEAERRIDAQISSAERLALLKQTIQKDAWGRVFHFETSDGPPPALDHLVHNIVQLTLHQQPWTFPSFVESSSPSS